MSARRLCALLGELGLEGHEALSPDSFEWPFQVEEVRPLLSWICSNLRPANVLSPAEISQYEQFLQEGTLLEGEDLDFAYSSISAFSGRRDNQHAVFGIDEGLKDIRDTTLAYESEILELEKQIKHMQSHLDKLSTHVSKLTQGRRARTTAISAVSGELSDLLDEKLSERNLEINVVLGKIASTVQELSHYLAGDEDDIYLAFSNFSSYLLGDSACLKELKQWFSKQFDTGPFQLVAAEGKSKCSGVSLDDITNCMLRGELESSQCQRVTKLQRLRSIFGISERKWVEAQVDNAREQAILMTIRSQLKSDGAHMRLDLQSLRRQHSELSSELSNLYQKEEKLLSETVPTLCSEVAQLQDTFILQGDYDLKVMRQEYYIGRQKMFINHLVNQLSRHQLLNLACQVERKAMLEVNVLLKVVESELQSYLLSTKSRVSRCFALIQAASEVHEQGAVDDRDTFLHSIRDLLSIHPMFSSSNVQGAMLTYVSVPGIRQQISDLHSHLVTLQSKLESSIPEDRYRYINKLCTLIQSLQQMLFASSTTAQPILTPWSLMKELAEMDKVNAQLSAAIEEVTRIHREKAEIVKHHPHEVGRERQVFVDFFCSADRLRNQVRDLTARAKALQF